MKNWRDWPIKTFSFPHRSSSKTLFYRGRLTQDIFKNCLAVVGARKMTHYGKEAVKKIIPSLVDGGMTIVSGFMYGVDTEAHRACLENGGRTIAVLASGLNNPYPPENNQLYTKIVNYRGLVISEYEREAPPARWMFPARNKIVAGVSRAILVVEGGERSGTLLTAKIAKKMAKPIFAVPGPITSTMSVAPNFLLKEGAVVVTKGEDVLTKLGIKIPRTPSRPLSRLSPLEKKIIRIISREPVSADEIVRQLNKDITEISVILTQLALKKFISENDGKYSA